MNADKRGGEKSLTQRKQREAERRREEQEREPQMNTEKTQARQEEHVES